MSAEHLLASDESEAELREHLAHAAHALAGMHALLNAAEEQRRLAKIGTLRNTIGDMRHHHEQITEHLLAISTALGLTDG